MKKKILVATGGGDCPGLNAVIRAIVKAASLEDGWEVWGSIEAFNGLMTEPAELVRLDLQAVKGIHVRGGTIIGTTNKGNPMAYPVRQPDGTYVNQDICGDLVQTIRLHGFDALISIGGDGSQRISRRLSELGLPVVGVPKTIDNDLSATDMTFGFQTAVQIATESLDKLITTAESHSRVLIMEVMGRDAGWIALHTAIAGGAEICLIPEIPYNLEAVLDKINSRYAGRRGFVNIVIAEGAKPQDGDITGRLSHEQGYGHVRLGGVCDRLQEDLKAAGCKADIRTTILGHVQRGGIPTAFDRVLATSFGVHAVQMIKEGKFGRMVALQNNQITDVTLEAATSRYNYVNLDSPLIRTARALGICLGT
ncbi:MAG: ATP-dependent 6-phosphofructokinase [Bacteroidia bacterium]|nr:ATP-dependent 6-phosphofructokinase [Bacteroidia bacterium]